MLQSADYFDGELSQQFLVHLGTTSSIGEVLQTQHRISRGAEDLRVSEMEVSAGKDTELNNFF